MEIYWKRVKLEEIPLGIVENNNYIEEKDFSTTTGIFNIPLFGQGGGAG